MESQREEMIESGSLQRSNDGCELIKETNRNISDDVDREKPYRPS
jgi:hypothetical protein